MLESRRRLLIFLGGAGVFAVRLFTDTNLSAQRVSPQPVPSPHAPDPHFPPGLNGPDIQPDTGQRRANPDDEKEIRKDVQKLFELASELKDQTDKTNSQLVLSLSFVKAAQQIEKLARKIKDLSKG